MGCGASSQQENVVVDAKDGGASLKEVNEIKTIAEAPGWTDPTRRYRGRAHATSVAAKPFRVHTSTASFAANAPCEDTMFTDSQPLQDFVGVYDGHGGDSCSRYCLDHTFELYRAARLGGKDTAPALCEAIGETERGYLAEQRATLTMRGSEVERGGRGLFAGSCMLIVTVDRLQRSLTVANLGDSRAVLAERDKHFGLLSSEALSFDHKASSDYERNRLACLFPNVEQSTLVAQKWDDNCQNYGHRVCGLAEFTRSVGDFEFKLPWAARYFNKLVSHRSQVAVPDEQRPWVTSTPGVMFRQLHHCHEFVITGCDGLWDEISSDAAVHAVGHFFATNPLGRKGNAAEFLMGHVLKLVSKRVAEEVPELGVTTPEGLGGVVKGKGGLRNVMDDISLAVIAFEYGNSSGYVHDSSSDDDGDDEAAEDEAQGVVPDGARQRRARCFSRGSAADFQLNSATDHARRSLASTALPCNTNGY